MSFFDSLGITIFFFLFIILSLTSLYIWTNISPAIPASENANITTTFNSSINNTISFWNNGFSTIYIILMLGSVLLTVFLNSNPALLVVWLLLNVAIIFVWDQLNVVLSIFTNTEINGGQLDKAIDFFQSDVGKIIPVINLLIGLFMFGRRAFT